MSDNWFTERERSQLCANFDCEEHYNGDEPCDIPVERPQSVDSQSDKKTSGFIGSNAKILQPSVEVVYSEEEE